MSHLKDPIFIVGAPRSGTTLLASMIAAHPSIVSGPETQLLNKVSADELERCTSDLNWPQRAVATLMGVTLSGERVVDLFDLTERDLLTYLSDQPHTVGAMFSAFFESAGRLPTGSRWLEKTPNHVIRVDTIMHAFPAARIVHIVRDPRDVATSLSRVPWAPNSPIANAWDWRQRYVRSRGTINTHATSVITVRYESLLAEPEDILTLVCEHLGITFDRMMLAPESSANTLATAVEHWKAKNSSVLDPSRAYSWRRAQGPATHAISVLCSEEILELEYPGSIEAQTTISAFIPNVRVAAMLDDFLVTASARGARVIEGRAHQADRLFVPAVTHLARAGLYRAALRVTKVRVVRALKRLPTSSMRASIRVPSAIRARVSSLST